jgi:NurA-like 5'-3' nuclease
MVISTFNNPYSQVNEEFVYWTWIQKLVDKDTDMSPQTLLVTLITNIVIRLGLTNQIAVINKTLKCVLPSATSSIQSTVDIISLDDLKYEETLKFQEVPYWIAESFNLQKKEAKDQLQELTQQQLKSQPDKDVLSAFGIQEGYNRYVKIEMVVDSQIYIFIAKVQTKSPIQ